jgi:NADPH-dependent glutamate synthase beta subunit-like oxidoreductase
MSITIFMTRKDFLKMCGILGIALPFQAALASCDDEPSIPFTGKVVIIGAGAGGLAAAYLLQQKGIDFIVLEASSTYGGRMRINTDLQIFQFRLEQNG